MKYIAERDTRPWCATIEPEKPLASYYPHAGWGHPHYDAARCSWCNPNVMKRLREFIAERDKK